MMKQVFWLVGICLFVLTSCKYQSQQTNPNKNNAILVGDTLKALITDTIETKYYTDNNLLWTPSKAQLDQVDSILIQSIKDTLAINNNFEIKNINSFYRQYVCYRDSVGDSIVFINAFCRLLASPVDSCGTIIWKKQDWKNKILDVMDGGACFWSIRINLTRKKYFDFI